MSFATILDLPTPEVAADLLQQRLELLECPITENAPSSWLQKTLFQPDETRITLINWLLSRIVDEKDITLTTSKKSVTDPREEFTFSVAALESLGIFKDKRVDFVKGTLPFADQFKIWGKLTRLAHAKSQLDENLVDDDVSSKLNEVVDFLTADNSANLKALRRRPRLFPPHYILPPSEHATHFPSLEVLLSESKEVVGKLKDCSQKLQTAGEFNEKKPMDESMKTLQIAKDDLVDKMARFSEIYGKDLEEFCDAPRSRTLRFSSSQEKLEQMHQMLSRFVNILEAAGTVRSFLADPPRNKAQNVLDEFLRTLCNRKESLKKEIGILEDAITRKKKSKET